jgi:hypothetical protein
LLWANYLRLRRDEGGQHEQQCLEQFSNPTGVEKLHFIFLTERGFSGPTRLNAPD